MQKRHTFTDPLTGFRLRNLTKVLHDFLELQQTRRLAVATPRTKVTSEHIRSNWSICNHLAIEKPLNDAAASVLQHVNDWLAEGFQLVQLADMDDYPLISEERAQLIYKRLALRAYTEYNVEYLRRLLEEQRASCDDGKYFDELVEQSQMTEKLELVFQLRDHSLVSKIIEEVAQDMRTTFGTKVNLFTDDDALDRLLQMLNMLYHEYKNLALQADYHRRLFRVIALTNR